MPETNRERVRMNHDVLTVVIQSSLRICDNGNAPTSTTNCASGLHPACNNEERQFPISGIIEVLDTEGRLELRDFGVFVVRSVKARKGRNPKTGDQVLVPERRRVAFKMGKVMDEKVNNGSVPSCTAFFA